MIKRKRILAGVFALVVGASLMAPVRASADDWNHDHHNYVAGEGRYHYKDKHHDAWEKEHDRHKEWEWKKDNDHYRAYPYANTPSPYNRPSVYNRPSPYEPPYYGVRPGPVGPGHQVVPPNGEGMVSRQNPNMVWTCDSDGHNCNWAPRR